MYPEPAPAAIVPTPVAFESTFTGFGTALGLVTPAAFPMAAFASTAMASTSTFSAVKPAPGLVAPVAITHSTFEFSAAAASTSNPGTTVVPHVSLIMWNRFQTTVNSFGLWKEYLFHPSYDPDALISTDDLYCPHASTIIADNDKQEEDSSCRNKSIKLLLGWQNMGSSVKSDDKINCLVYGILYNPEF